MALVPITGLASGAFMWITVLAMFMGFAKLAGIGVICYGVIALFHLITLPVEYDASRRAKVQLVRLGLVQPEEQAGVSRVLNAAALTYVAALVAALFSLLHLILIVRGNNRD